jgi:hypothetical protein
MTDRWPLTGRAEELRLIGEALGDGEYKGIVAPVRPASARPG